MPKKLTTEIFLERAKIKHGGFYDYSRTSYVNNTSTVIIICPKHGQFSQTPKAHMIGNGCNKCGEGRAADKRRGTTEDFVQRARRVHGDCYDYSQARFVGSKEKLTIVCLEHGPWRVTASSHVAGTGCPACGGRMQLTTEQFIERAQAKHGDKFDYTETVYVNSETPVAVICPEHGQSKQLPNNHLAGSGCAECAYTQRGISRRSNTKDFIRRARKVHGERYDYSKVDYVRTGDPITIICAEHGVFTQSPANHLQGHGCLLCGHKNAGQYHKKDTLQFINAARKFHGDKYDYSESEYAGARERLTIICPKHGSFEQIAGVHLIKGGCLSCSYELRGLRASIDFAAFLARAKLEHGDEYDYRLVDRQLAGGQTKVTIICREHGAFSQAALNHIGGSGCPVCKYVKVAASNRKSTVDFIQKSIAVHGDKYDYTEVDYNGAHDHVIITCPIDGSFLQSATSHLSGTGCPRCSRREQGAPRNLIRALRGEFDSPKGAFAYVITFTFPGSDQNLFKIGSGSGTRFKSTASSIRRVGGTVADIESWEFETSGEAIVFEHIAHDQVIESKFPVPPEFKFPGYSEVFSEHPNLLSVDWHPTLTRFRLGERWDPRGPS
jgi:hypothetical protein